MEPIEFYKYERITDDLYYLSRNVVLRFAVGLAYYKDGQRNIFHREYEYEREHRNVVSIKRNYDYYLILENLDPENKQSIMIGVRDFPRFRQAIQVALSWFQDSKYAKLFATSKGKLIMTSPQPCCELNGFPGGKYIRIDPTIIEYGMANDDRQPGISITLSDPTNYVNITVDSLIGLDYILSCVNMISMAQTMLSSIPMNNMQINRTNLLDKPLGSNSFVSAQKKEMIERPSQSGLKCVERRFIGSKTMESL